MSKLFKLYLFSAFFFFSCQKSPEKQVAIKLGSQIWTFQEIQDYMELRLTGLPENRKNIKEEILREIIFYSLLKDWAEKNNSPQSKKLLTKEEKLLFSKDKKKLKAFKIFKNYNHLKSSLIEELAEKIPPPPLKQQKAFYTKNKSQFIEPAQCRLEQILVSNQKQAQSLLNKIKKGLSFSSLKTYSLKKDPGWVKEAQWPLFDQACFKEKEPLSPVLKSSYGWHIFLRTGKKAGRQKTFSEVQKEIIKALKKQELPLQIQGWLKEESAKKPVFKDKKLLDQIKIQYKRERI